ncbi:unnamed protein product [Ixodes pacificus]
MSNLVSQLFNGQVQLVRDPRTKNWPLAGNVPFISVLLVSYVYLVKVAGPRFMKGRQPLQNLRPFIMAHNLFMVLANAFFIYHIGKRSYFGGGYNWFCQGLDYSRSQLHLELINLNWWYLLVRIADFLDTFFFVLRKKDSHVSLLHVAHHVLVVFSGWFGVTYGSDGQTVLCVLINSSIHVVMYTYYFLSLLGPAVQKHLWWKRYLTQLQLGQFVLIFVHSMVPTFVDCGFPAVHQLIISSQVIFYFVMFMRFYIRSYTGKTRVKGA